MHRKIDQFLTYIRLGPVSLWRVGFYRLGLKLHIHPAQHLTAKAPAGPFFSAGNRSPSGLSATDRWIDKITLFSVHDFPMERVPDWHVNRFDPGARADSTSLWSDIPDFDPSVGDIKTVWELSRFGWLLAMAQRAALGDSAELDRMNLWLSDWVDKNRPYHGANWKCGQEASIRVMHLTAAAILLGQLAKPTAGLTELIRLHLARIAPTIDYAIGQQNNHGTSEAAALFIGGSWLQALGEKDGRRWADTGRRWLENRAVRLIESDGTFSQYSVVYHRFMLDSFALAEVVRRQLNLVAFSNILYRRLQAATHWLRQLTDEQTGDAPNLGANDGAHLLAISQTNYRDFRPSLQLAAALFCEARAISADGPWNQPLHWFGLAVPTEELPPLVSESFDQGGIHILRSESAVAYLRYPRFRFRPGQADALHVDLWVDGKNLLRDAGSYAYNSSPADTAYFNGTVAHNTAQFDGRDQMPRLGRFLFGSWLKARNVQRVETATSVSAAAGYRDSFGAQHIRALELQDRKLIIRDNLKGRAEQAVLRWRLPSGSWVLAGQTLRNDGIVLDVQSDGGLLTVQLGEGLESLHYMEKQKIPVMEITCSVPSMIVTEITF